MASLTDQEYAQKYGSLPPGGAVLPQSLSDDEYEQRYGENVVAARARASLASRGLTPEAIKANPAEPMPPQYSPLYSGVGEMLGMDDGSGFQTQLRTPDKGFGGETLANLNPVTVAKGAAKTFQDVADPFGMAHEGNITEVVPNFAEIARESWRRGESGESAAGMYGPVAANAIIAATGTGVGKAFAKGPQIEAAAVKSYAGITDSPLTESLARQMMDRGIKGSAEKIAANASKAEQAAIATKEALIRDNPMPERWRSTPERRNVARQVRSAAEEAEIQANIQTVAESIKKPQSVGGNILTGKVGKVLRMVPGVDAAVHIAGTVKDLYEFPGTTAFKTTTALLKRQFGEAMSRGDQALAAKIGAGIATGSLAADDFGHRAAITQLAQEAEQAGPELRRQVVASKKFYYTDPSGASIDIPPNVASAMTDADVSEVDSPINKWLTAMSRQKKIKPGGTIGYR